MGSEVRRVPTSRRLLECVEVEGIGLHLGARARARVRPAPPGAGLTIRVGDGERRLSPGLADRAAVRCTRLAIGGATVWTVEHLLAALGGAGIRDARIEVEGPEVPILDGSAAPWVERLAAASAEEAEGGSRRLAERIAAFRFARGGARYRVEPAERFSAIVLFDGPRPFLGEQRVRWDGGFDSFRASVAPARTFASLGEVEALRGAGLAQGGNLDCAAVIGPCGPVDRPLRFPDEPARHKLLDLVGDLMLLGELPPVRIRARAPFHAANATLADRLASATAG
jgi:UDP-3-O-[3-hydroxymyristoyl] N-acetylglucosamine deacetylase